MPTLLSGAGTVVSVSDALAARLRRRGYTDADTPAQAPSEDARPASFPEDVFPCPEPGCGFDAKTAAGLGAHRRRHD